MLETGKRELLRALPAVDAVIRSPAAQDLASRYGTKATTAVARGLLQRAREVTLAGGEPEVSEESVLAGATNILLGRGLGRGGDLIGLGRRTTRGRSGASVSVGGAGGAAGQLVFDSGLSAR